MRNRCFVHPGLAKLFVVGIIGLLLLALAASTSRGALAKGGRNAAAYLLHTPTGLAQLHYDASRQQLTVSVWLMGLAPNSSHPAHIHLGVCSSNGPIRYPLKNVVANAKGQAAVSTVLAGVAAGIPAGGWYLNVHNGPTLATPAQASALACGVIFNPHRATDVLTLLGATPDPNQHASGVTRLSLTGQDLTVSLEVTGLVPNSRHAAHVHAGTCLSTGGILYDLSPLVADAQGHASKTLVFHGVASIPPLGWDVNVHLGTDLSSQTGYDPVLCGVVLPQM
jgi:CHRD domain